MIRSAEELLGDDVIAAVRRPIEAARGLPGLAYTSEEFFQLEQRKYFARTWMGVRLHLRYSGPRRCLADHCRRAAHHPGPHK